MTTSHKQNYKERRKSWLPQSNILTSLFYPRQQASNGGTGNYKRRSQSLDQGNHKRDTTDSFLNSPSLVSECLDIHSSKRTQTPPITQKHIPNATTLPSPSAPTYNDDELSTLATTTVPSSRRHKPNNFVGHLFSKAKKHPQLKRAATLIETTANHYKKSLKETDKLHRRHDQDKYNSGTEDDDEEPLLVSLFGLREDDVDRMQQKNDLIRLAFAGEFTRPMDEQTIEKVLDIGCGPLSWSIDFAKTHPNAQVIGMDYVNMIPPEIAMDLPSNCQLLIHNCIKEFPYDDATVDLCHVRFMNVSLTMEQYGKMVAHCWRVLKPGGYLELMEMDMLVYSPGPVTELLNQQVIDLVRTLGLKPRLARLLKDVLPKDAGLTDQHITEFYRSLPIGNWGGRLGWLFRDDLLYALTHARNFGNTMDPATTATAPSSLSMSGKNNNSERNGNQEENDDGFKENSNKDNGTGAAATTTGDNVDDDGDSTKSENDLFENRLLAAEKELEQYKSYSNFHFIRVQKPL